MESTLPVLMQPPRSDYSIHSHRLQCHQGVQTPFLGGRRSLGNESQKANGQLPIASCSLCSTSLLSVKICLPSKRCCAAAVWIPHRCWEIFAALMSAGAT